MLTKSCPQAEGPHHSAASLVSGGISFSQCSFFRFFISFAAYKFVFMDDSVSDPEKKEVRCFIAEDPDRPKGPSIPEERKELYRRFDRFMELNGGKIFSDRTVIIMVVIMWILEFLFEC